MSSRSKRTRAVEAPQPGSKVGLTIVGCSFLVCGLAIYTTTISLHSAGAAPGIAGPSAPEHAHSRTLRRYRSEFDPREGIHKSCRPPPANMTLQSLRMIDRWRSKKVMPRASITVVTQMTIERIFQLVGLCQEWEDRIAVLIASPFIPGFGAANVQDATTNGSSEAQLVERLNQLHIWAETAPDAKCALDIEFDAHDVLSWDDPMLGKYPVNNARNRAMWLVETPLLILLDVDFMPSASLKTLYRGTPDAYDKLLDYLVTNRSLFVFPAFGHADFKPGVNGTDARTPNDVKLLTDKKLMVAAYESRYMPIFYQVENPADHGPTNYTRWVTATEPYQIEYEVGYEPYVLVAKQFFPWADERFIGYYRNKVSILEYMYSLGVKYMVHPTVYVMHRGHLKSATFQATEALTKRSTEHLMNMKRLHLSIQHEIGNMTYSPVTSFADRCPGMIPPPGGPVIAGVMNLTKWRRPPAK